MTVATQLLREEHEILLPRIEQLRVTADSIGGGSQDVLQRSVDAVYEFLMHHLIPHARAEEAALYPEVGRILGTPQATATMSLDHAEISHLTAELRSLRSHISSPAFDADHAKDLRRVLYGLYALVKLHLKKEEEVYLPILDARLSEGEAHQLFHKLAQAAHGEAGHSDR